MKQRSNRNVNVMVASRSRQYFNQLQSATQLFSPLLIFVSQIEVHAASSVQTLIQRAPLVVRLSCVCILKYEPLRSPPLQHLSHTFFSPFIPALQAAENKWHLIGGIL